jgi:Flp pilus assembly pilin Flp
MIHMIRLRQPDFQHGQSNVEYAVIIALRAILVVIVLTLLGVNLTSVYCGVVAVFGDTPPRCETGLLLTDNFDDLDGWSFVQGNGWENQDGQLCVTQGGEHRGFTGDETWADYAVTVDQSELAQGDGYGVYFRASNEPNINAYVFQYDPGYRGGPYPNGAFLIRTVVNGGERSPIAVAAAPTDFEWNNVRRSIRIDVQGNTYTVFIDGTQVLQAQDDTYSEGRVGLRTWDGSRACFDDLSVQR